MDIKDMNIWRLRASTRHTPHFEQEGLAKLALEKKKMVLPREEEKEPAARPLVTKAEISLASLWFWVTNAWVPERDGMGYGSRSEAAGWANAEKEKGKASHINKTITP